MPSFNQASPKKQKFQQRLGLQHKFAIPKQLKQHLPAALNTRWTGRHWVHASLFASIGVMIAAMVPGFSNARDILPSVDHTTYALALPALDSSTQSAHNHWQSVQIRAGQTLGAIFEEYDIPSTTMYRILEDSDAKKALTQLRPGAELAFELSQDGTLQKLRFDQDPLHRVELSIGEDQITQNIIERETTTRTVVTSGEITSSLYAAALDAGLSPADVVTIADSIFQYDIDFDKDLHRGDRFSVVLDETWREGERLGTSKILAATFTSGNKTYSGLRFERDGKVEYFDATGRPLKKSFIRMPISYARLSSNFGSRRHPILGTIRMHKGVDYAASTGTPIMAAGDARVQLVATQRGYGNVVILDHGRGYTTLYGHMSRFANIRQGQQIKQGAVIGYVGATGMATGPHLHYEFRVNGQHRNPLSVTMPPPEPLKGTELEAFHAQTMLAMERIHSMEERRYANLETQPAPTANKS